MKYIFNYIKVKFLGIINEYALLYSYTVNYLFLESFKLTLTIVLCFFHINKFIIFKMDYS